MLIRIRFEREYVTEYAYLDLVPLLLTGRWSRLVRKEESHYSDFQADSRSRDALPGLLLCGDVEIVCPRWTPLQTRRRASSLLWAKGSQSGSHGQTL
eukprot:5880732-Pleurochrysis_carterae.AAC.2